MTMFSSRCIYHQFSGCQYDRVEGSTPVKEDYCKNSFMGNGYNKIVNKSSKQPKRIIITSGLLINHIK